MKDRPLSGEFPSLLDYVGFVVGGLFLFALHIHYRDWRISFAIGGFLLAALSIVHFIFAHPSSAASAFGFAPFSKKVPVFLLLGCAIGVAFGILYRFYYAQSVFPNTFYRFACVACLVGATEELIYRGFVQGVMRPAGKSGAVILASLFHTTYKCALFTAFPLPEGINLYFLAVATFFSGIVLGGLRQCSGSVFPAMAAHAFFDLIVYGDYFHAPWWIWS